MAELMRAGPILHPKLRAALYQRKLGYVHWRLRYGTFVSFEHRLMYMETPKNACSTTKMLLWRLARLPDDDLSPARSHRREQFEGRPSVMDIDPATAQHILLAGGYFRFCFLRDPVSRLMSAYKNKVLDGALPQYQRARELIMAEHSLGSADEITFDMFAMYACQQDNADRDPHWQLQARLNLMNMIDYDFVGRVERYAEDMRHVLDTVDAPAELADFTGVVHNKSPSLDLSVSPSVQREIEAAYAADYEQIGRT